MAKCAFELGMILVLMLTLAVSMTLAGSESEAAAQSPNKDILSSVKSTMVKTQEDLLSLSKQRVEQVQQNKMRLPDLRLLKKTLTDVQLNKVTRLKPPKDAINMQRLMEKLEGMREL